ncbi:hypothetical protein FJZ55_09095, partial [Candidatus Woesearchaeota archaeon]|nr:hypothetical protein [Candidatus Woesearchaeota archaeon]
MKTSLPHKPDVTTELQLTKIYAAYMRAIGSTWKVARPFFEARSNLLVFENRGLNNVVAAIIDLIGWGVRMIRARRAAGGGFPACDVLIYYSSKKPSVYPILEILGSQLAGKGYRCAVVSLEGMTLKFRDTISQVAETQVVAYTQLLNGGVGWRWSAFLLAVSLFYTCLLAVLILAREPQIFLRVFSNPFNVWHAFLLSARRLQIADQIMQEIKPRLLITRGDHLPMASALALSKHAASAHTVWFFNEAPTREVLPCLSKDMWVYNQQVIDSLKKIMPVASQPDFHIVGNAEADFVLAAADQPTPEGIRLSQQIGTCDALLYCSDFIPDLRLGEGAIVEEILWLAQAAGQCPHWRFIYKPRPGRDAKDTPGIEKIVGLPNVIIPQDDVPLSHFLRCSNVRAVGSRESTALFVAAGVGKMALRF